MTGMIPELTVVTVLYRSREMLAATLPTWVASADGLPVDFVFVDNAPEDGCSALIAEALPAGRHRYLPDPANPGFAAGCNRGVRVAGAGHVLLLNPDVTLTPEALSTVLKAVAETPDQPVAVGLAMHDTRYTGIALHPISLFIDRRSGSAREPIGPSGGAAVFPTELYQRFGGLHEPFFAWGEDADLALRLYAAGVRTATLDLGLPHAWGHSVAGDGDLSSRRAFLLARNRVVVAMRTLSWPLLLAGLPLAAVSHLALAARRIRQGTLRPFLAGVWRGLREGPRARGTVTGRRFGLRDLIAHGRTAQGRVRPLSTVQNGHS
jgi:N-acetylglucosaminyl-diphospho-decaprenol L-rhamnosyltransferase